MQKWIRSSRFIRRWLCATTIGCAIPLGAFAREQTYGFVWANDPSAASYTPASTNAYNDSGTPPRIEHSGTGQYNVAFPGLSALYATSGNVQVTAYGNTTDSCKVAGWSGDTVSVACFDATGNPVDTVYSLLYLFPDSHTNSHFAFALADQSGNESYTPDAAHSFNGGGAGAITATRMGTGNYTMSWSGISGVGSGGGHIEVTAEGPGNARCRSEAWGTETAFVQCVDPSGAPVDSAYSILYWRPEAGDDGLAFAWADQPTDASYTPNANYSYNAGGGAITASRSSTGVYSLAWTGMAGVGIDGGNIQVTAVASNVLCKVGSWATDSATVLCFDNASNPVNSSYDVLFVKPPKKPWSQEYAFAGTTRIGSNYVIANSYNYLNGPISLTHSGVGVFSVQFGSLDALVGGGNVQVSGSSPLNDNGGYCKVASWTANAAIVLCFDHTGTAADADFDLFYLKPVSHPTAVAYAWADQATSASYTPNPIYSYNPKGGAIIATRNSTGVYSMTWSGFSANGTTGGHPNVTAYGTSNTHCQVVSWGNETVTVGCYDGAGNPADSRYSILFLRPDAVDDGLAFAWADQPANASYTPNALYSFSSGDGAITANRIGLGNYETIFGGMDLRGIGPGTLLANSYSNAADQRCTNYIIGSPDAGVKCSDSSGNLVDTRYDALIIVPVAAPEPGRVAMLAAGIVALGLLARRRPHSTWALAQSGVDSTVDGLASRG